MSSDRKSTAHQHPLHKVLQQRIAIIDGATGTTIRTYGMTEAAHQMASNPLPPRARPPCCRL